MRVYFHVVFFFFLVMGLCVVMSRGDASSHEDVPDIQEDEWVWWNGSPYWQTGGDKEKVGESKLSPCDNLCWAQANRGHIPANRWKQGAIKFWILMGQLLINFL